MAVNRRRFLELCNQKQTVRKLEEEEMVGDEANLVHTSDVNTRVQSVVIGTRRFLEPVSFYDVEVSDVKHKVIIPWFKSSAVLADIEKELELFFP